MKIQKIVTLKTKLLQLNLIKSRIYKEKHLLKKINVKNIEHRLKKALQVIYKYQVSQKKILFLGLTESLCQKIKQLPGMSSHTFIPESVWINGVIANQVSVFRYLSQNTKLSSNWNFKVLFNLKTQHNLVVIFNSDVNKNALIEGYQTRIPIISLNADLNIFDNRPTYKIPGNLKLTTKKIRSNFFLSILISILKKASYFKLSILNKKIKSNAFHKKK